MENFWQNLKQPILALAPMADVTDAAFRQIIAKYGKPDVFYTEFVSADGLCSAGREKLLRELYFTPMERSIVAQIFGANPENCRQAAALARELGFDGVDLNMGCPVEKIVGNGAGAAHLKDPKRAQEIILATMEGAGDLPVSIKTRIGYSIPEIEKWTARLLEVKPAAIVFHLRTRAEMSKVPAHWELLPVAVKLARGSGTLILGNGDVQTLAEARAKADETGADGVMLGRAIFGNPWLFAKNCTASLTERLRVMVEHAQLYTDLFCTGPINTKLFNGHTKNFATMKKHFKAYVSGFSGAADLRARLMKARDVGEVKEIVGNWQATTK